jgi:shikimate dehydrogenase
VTIGGGTRVAAVIGHPVRHSLSPAIHNAAFAALGIDWVFVAFDVAPGAGAAAVSACHLIGLGGMSVTMPHKGAAASAVDRLTTEARRLGAVNCIVVDGDELVGHNTDGAGFLDTLRHDEGFDPAGRRTVVLGAGGAARAVALALADAGAADVVIVNRTAARGAAAAELAGDVGRVGMMEEVVEADLVVNATPIGMRGGGAEGEIPVPGGLLRPHQLVVDLVYEPRETSLVRAARTAGASAVGGVGMLVHQAGHAVREWTGLEPPLEVMSAAVVARLAHRD